MIGSAAVDFLREVALGTRVVIRYALPDGSEAGATDALGDLTALTGETCTVETKRGPEVVRLADVIAAKPVPPAPAPRTRSRSPLG